MNQIVLTESDIDEFDFQDSTSTPPSTAQATATQSNTKPKDPLLVMSKSMLRLLKMNPTLVESTKWAVIIFSFAFLLIELGWLFLFEMLVPMMNGTYQMSVISFLWLVFAILCRGFVIFYPNLSEKVPVENLNRAILAGGVLLTAMFLFGYLGGSSFPVFMIVQWVGGEGLFNLDVIHLLEQVQDKYVYRKKIE